MQHESTGPQPLWFHAVRAIALCSVFAIVVPWYFAILAEPRPEKSDLLIPLYFAPLWAPYIWIFLRVNSGAESLACPKALALAISWSVWGFLLFSAVFLFMLSSMSFSNEWQAKGVIGGLALLQLSFMVASINAYRSTKRPKGSRILLWRLGVAVCILLGFFLTIPFIHFAKPASNEASAVAALRNINTAQIVFAETNRERGFAASLQELGPSPGAELIDAVLASGKKSGYIITMLAAPPDPGGRIDKYTLTARPQHFGKDETRSFLTDQSGTIHFTTQNRAPTTQDPVL
jgi:hypothetical protein